MIWASRAGRRLRFLKALSISAPQAVWWRSHNTKRSEGKFMLNKKVMFTALSFFLLAVIGAGQTQRADYDVIIRNGMVYDGTGGAPLRADVGVRDNQIGAIGDLSKAKATNEIDARGMAVAPGFINMLSHSENSLIADYRSLGELRQGVTTQIFGESSMGPISDEMKKTQLASQGDIKFDIPWTTLAEYLKYLESRGISQNAASFVGAGTLRAHVIGLEDKPPTPKQLERMKELLRREMEAGALGVTTALIYPPNFFAKTDELIELCKVASKYRGKYIAHIRSEANQFMEAVEETLRIAREANIPAEIYHLKASGE